MLLLGRVSIRPYTPPGGLGFVSGAAEAFFHSLGKTVSSLGFGQPRANQLFVEHELHAFVLPYIGKKSIVAVDFFPVETQVRFAGGQKILGELRGLGAKRFDRMIGLDRFGRVGADQPNTSAAFEQQSVAVDDTANFIRTFGQGLGRVELVLPASDPR